MTLPPHSAAISAGLRPTIFPKTNSLSSPSLGAARPVSPPTLGGRARQLGGKSFYRPGADLAVRQIDIVAARFELRIMVEAIGRFLHHARPRSLAPATDSSVVAFARMVKPVSLASSSSSCCLRDAAVAKRVSRAHCGRAHLLDQRAPLLIGSESRSLSSCHRPRIDMRHVAPNRGKASGFHIAQSACPVI